MTGTGTGVMRAVIVDDEPLALAMLRAMLEPLPGIEIVAECRNGREAIAAIRTHSPDLVFLDIQMPGKNGFDVVKSVQADVMPMVVFATAYDSYAIRAFDLHAVDYILKPLDPARVKQAVERADLRRLALTAPDRKTPLIGAIEDIAQASGKVGGVGADAADGSARHFAEGRLVIRDGGAIALVPIVEIDWVDAAGDYMCVHVGGATHILRSTLKQLLDRLDPALFRRVHRSTVVNLQRISRIVPLKKGECMLHLIDGTQIKLSRSFRDAIGDLLR